jgi:hypothetical protein
MYLGLTYLNVTWLGYLLRYDPYIDKQESNKEFFNSYIFMLFTYFIPSFTLMTPNTMVKYRFGKYAIGTIGFLILVNLIWTLI